MKRLRLWYSDDPIAPSWHTRQQVLIAALEAYKVAKVEGALVLPDQLARQVAKAQSATSFFSERFKHATCSIFWQNFSLIRLEQSLQSSVCNDVAVHRRRVWWYRIGCSIHAQFRFCRIRET